jgi:diphthamide synthase (EF-2-diphthine--ammonia ligase)
MLAVDTLVFAPWWKVDDFARVMSIATMGISAFIVIAAALKLKPLKNR